MADKTSIAAYATSPTVANVITSGTISVNGVTTVFDEDSTSVEITAAIERAKIQFLDYMSDKA